MAWTGLVLLLLLGQAGKGRAEQPDLAIIPVTRGDERADSLASLAVEVANELKRRDLAVIPMLDVADRFRAEHSREPAVVTQADVDFLSEQTKFANDAYSKGDYPSVLRHVGHVQERVAQALESLNRDPRVRVLILRAAGSGILAVLHQHHTDRDAALELATWCLHTFPGLDLTTMKGPPELRQVFQDAWTQLQNNRALPLTIDSDHQGCSVYLQGQRIDRVPATFKHPAPLPYVAQVECDNSLTSRVHTLTAAKPQVYVDLRFDRAVRTQGPSLRLHYEAIDESVVRADAFHVATLVGAKSALVLYGGPKGLVSLRRVSKKDGGAMDLPAEHTAAQLSAVLEFILNGKTQREPLVAAQEPQSDGRAGGMATREDDPIPRPPTNALAQAPVLRKTRTSLWVGASLAGAGAAGFAVAGVLLRKRISDGDALKLNPEALTLQHRWQHERPGIYAAAALGTTAGSAAAVLLSRYVEPDEHWWLPLATAGVGAAGLIGGSVLIAGATKCGSGLRAATCIQGDERVDRGALFLLASAPFLTFSLTQLVRWMLPSSPDPRMQASIGPQRFEARATFRF